MYFAVMKMSMKVIPERESADERENKKLKT